MRRVTRAIVDDRVPPRLRRRDRFPDSPRRILIKSWLFTPRTCARNAHAFPIYSSRAKEACVYFGIAARGRVYVDDMSRMKCVYRAFIAYPSWNVVILPGEFAYKRNVVAELVFRAARLSRELSGAGR
jgi:hypothetical protein